MVGVLNWRYNYGSDKVLDAINSKNFVSRSDLADFLGMNIKTLGRRIKSLKEDGKLIVHRYAENNFIYMIGEDAEFGWNAYEAKEILGYRDDCEDMGHTVVNPASVRLYDIPEVSTPLVLSAEESAELDICIDKLFPR